MKIYGYCIQIMLEEGEAGYIAFAPGVGGVYEEGKTKEEAISNAYEAVYAILETRLELKDPIVEDNPNLKVLTAPPHLEYINSIKDITDGYIATPRCLVPANA